MLLAECFPSPTPTGWRENCGESVLILHSAFAPAWLWVDLPALPHSSFIILHSAACGFARPFNAGCWMCRVQEPRLWLLAHRHPHGPFPLTGCQSPRSLAGDSPDNRRSTSDCRSEVLRRIYGEARTRSGGGERAYHGRPDDSYLAVVSPRSQRIPLAPRHFRGRRFSAPRRGQFDAGERNLYPGLR